MKYFTDPVVSVFIVLVTCSFYRFGDLQNWQWFTNFEVLRCVNSDCFAWSNLLTCGIYFNSHFGSSVRSCNPTHFCAGWGVWLFSVRTLCQVRLRTPCQVSFVASFLASMCAWRRFHRCCSRARCAGLPLILNTKHARLMAYLSRSSWRRFLFPAVEGAGFDSRY